MEKQQNKANCISCAHYDVETHLCTNSSGLLREIEMSDALAEAEHGCKEFSEVRYRLTPAGLLKLILEDYNVKVSIKKASLIVDKFMGEMVKHGYIEKDENTTDN